MKFVRPALLLTLAIGVAGAHPLANQAAHARAASARTVMGARSAVMPAKSTTDALSPVRTVRLAQVANSRSGSASTAVAPSAAVLNDMAMKVPSTLTKNSPRKAASAMPALTPNAILFGTSGSGFSATSFDGINAAQDFLAGGADLTGGVPPDNCTAVGNGDILEAVNVAGQVFTTAGTPLTPVFNLESLFGLDPTGFGVTYFIKDPSCLYAGGHFFLSVVQASFGVTPDVVSTGDDILLAVSATNDPTGAYHIYDFPVDNYPDQPVLGANADAIFITSNLFLPFTNLFLGTRLDVLQLSALETGATANHEVWKNVLDFYGDQAYHLWFQKPAADGPLSSNVAFAAETFGGSTLTDSRLDVLAATNTTSINTTPAIVLLNTIVNVLPYINTFFDEVTQPAGPGLDPGPSTILSRTFATGMFWAAWNTGVTGPDEGSVDASEYAVLQPTIVTTLFGPVLTVRLLGNGYISAGDTTVLYPVVGANSKGQAEMFATVVGADTPPSAARIDILPSALQHNASFFGVLGVASLFEPGPVPLPFGDYSDAATDEKGNLAGGVEYVALSSLRPQSQPDAVISPFGNWGTREFYLTPNGPCIKVCF